jgi:hypothetical protein
MLLKRAPWHFAIVVDLVSHCSACVGIVLMTNGFAHFMGYKPNLARFAIKYCRKNALEITSSLLIHTHEGQACLFRGIGRRNDRQSFH